MALELGLLILQFRQIQLCIFLVQLFADQLDRARVFTSC